ncbi:MAG TPA: c-type cytochrome [Anaeromyxobacteraceae bacterium]|nr:c-type cytochrome [Anaeromyxobacteraceae bacterium]
MRRTALAVAASLAAASIASAQEPPAPPAFAPPNLSEKGVRAMAANCASCHGTDGRSARGSTVAGLAGRSSAELVRTLEQFRSGERPATIMHQLVKGYGDAEIAAIADWFSKQKPSGETR